MRIFVAVAERMSFAAAARQLVVSPPAVTRAIAQLEKALGVPLIIRSTRSMQLTETGERFFEDCLRILGDIVQAGTSAAGIHGSPSGLLTITAPLILGKMHVMPALMSFLSENPAVSSRVLLLDRMVDLTGEGVDIAVRIGQRPVTTCHSREIGTVRRVVCGSPDYLARCGTPLMPSELDSHTIIQTTGSPAAADWHSQSLRSDMMARRARLVCNDMEAAIYAAIEGLGLVRALSFEVAQAVAAGTLRLVLQTSFSDPLPIHVLYPKHQRSFAKTRSFVDHLTTRFRNEPSLAI